MAGEAQRIVDAYRSGETVPVADAPNPGSLEEAERIQDDVLRSLGWTPAAWKLGASNVGSRTGLGFSRSFSAALPAERLLQSPATLKLSQPRQPGLECELAVSFAASPGLPGELAGMSDADLHARVRGCVGAFHAAIELPGSRYPDLGAAGPFALVADNGAADWIVVGPPGPADFEHRLWRGQVVVDGVVVAEGDTGVFCDTPLALLADHVGRMARRGHQIMAGAVVVLGSVTPHYRVAKPCATEIRFEGLDPVRLDFVA